MRLSLWMIKEYLKQYQSVLEMQQDDAITIEEIRIGETDHRETGIHAGHILFLGREKDFVKNGSDLVVGVHASGKIYFNSEDIFEISNAILETFSHYSRWQEVCMKNINEGCTLSTLLGLGEQMIGKPLLMVDASQCLIAQSPEMQQKQTFPETIEADDNRKSYPVELLKEFNQKHSKTFFEHQVFYLPDDYFPTAAYCKHIFVEHERMATLILPVEGESESHYLPHMLSIFAEQLREWMRVNHSEDLANQVTSYFARALDDSENASESLKHRLSLFGWQDSCEKQIYVLQSVLEQIHFDSYFSRIFSDNFAGTYAIPYHKKVVILVNCDMVSRERFIQKMVYQMDKNNYFGAESFPFSQLKNISEAYDQCTELMERQLPEKGILYNCRKWAMHYITDLAGRNTGFHLLHPVLQEMEDYDAERKTSYYETLFCFLKNERNHQKTAETLFIHRNTLFLRLSKINSLWELNLEDAEERFYLLYSFYERTYH